MNYHPDNSQAAQRYAVAPFQKVAVQLRANRVNGEFFSSLEGENLYVEQTDWPVQIALINQATGKLATFIARNGLDIRAPFKGIWISHPDFTGTPGSQPIRTQLILAKNQERHYANEAAQPVTCSPCSVRYNSQLATQLNVDIAVPQGARYLSELRIAIPGATMTSATWSTTCEQDFGPAQSLWFTDEFGIAFNGSNPLAGTLQSIPVPSGFYALEQNIAIPSAVRYITVNLVGTGFVYSAGSGFGIRATFS